jgi:hypothetical protein
MLSAQRRFAVGRATVEVTLSVREDGLDGEPPETPLPPPSPLKDAAGGVDGLGGGGSRVGMQPPPAEDIPGVPTEAWRSGRRGPLSSVSFQPGTIRD